MINSALLTDTSYSRAATILEHAINKLGSKGNIEYKYPIGLYIFSLISVIFRISDTTDMTSICDVNANGAQANYQKDIAKLMQFYFSPGNLDAAFGPTCWGGIAH